MLGAVMMGLLVVLPVLSRGTSGCDSTQHNCSGRGYGVTNYGVTCRGAAWCCAYCCRATELCDFGSCATERDTGFGILILFNATFLAERFSRPYQRKRWKVMVKGASQ